jgi:hypothetical protein
MPVFLELRDGHENLDESSHVPGQLGPVLGPFISARILRDTVRVTIAESEIPFVRIADWILYGAKYYADVEIIIWSVEIISTDQMGPGRTRRRQAFSPALAGLPAKIAA